MEDVTDLPLDGQNGEDQSILASIREDGIKGLDVDVLISMLMTLIIAFLLISRIIGQLIRKLQERRQNQEIHPDHTENVNEFREAEQRRQATERRIEEAKSASTHECPICLGDADFPVLTDCGHVFCCRCIIGYWQHSKPIVSPIDCAICRGTIHMLLPLQWPSHDDNTPGDVGVNDQLYENNMRINDYNRRFSKDRPWLDYFKDIPVLLPYLVRNFLSEDIFTIVSQIRMFGMVLTAFFYFLIPLDVVPESIYGVIGLLDDIVIAALVLVFVFKFLRDYMAARGFGGGGGNRNANENVILQAAED